MRLLILRRSVAASSVVLGLALGSAAAWAQSACQDLSPPRLDPPVAAKRAITTDDLARLRDIGMPGYSVYEQTPFTVSPDNKLVAFTLRRGDPASNAYCLGLYVADIATGHTRQIDAGGEFISYVIGDLRGLVNPSGIPAIDTPAWSPDGLWIAYLKRVSGITQIWRVRVDGTASVQVTRLKDDAEAIAWSSDGSRILFSTRPGLAQARAEIDREGLTGYRQDGRVIPVAGPKPFPRAPIAFAYWSIDPENGAMRRANEQERGRVDRGDDRPRPPNARFFAQAGSSAAWIAPRFPAHSQSPTSLWLKQGSAAAVRCDAAACRDKLFGVWLSPDGREVRFLRRQGWADSETALYRWEPGQAPKAILATDDVLSNCQAAGDLLVCARESALLPIRLVAIDMRSGKSRLIVDPNPEISQRRLGSVQRLHWRNRFGVESFGDLVLPPDHRPGQRHPLIITQYKTRGFLRGAIGDTYPIQVFAAHGFAVLSLDRPERWAQSRARPDDARTFEQFERENNRRWIDRRNVLSTLLTGLHTVESMGVIDPRRVGITGTSEGSMGLWFALNNTRNIFAAASMGSCCMDPQTLMAVGGEAWARQLQASGYPAYSKLDPRFWRPLSLAMNVGHIRIPLLIQVPDDEYSMALETVTTFRDKGRPLDFYVFPNEHHNIWQPAHRLAMYDRNLAFFERWLAPPSNSPPAVARGLTATTEARPRRRTVRGSGHRHARVQAPPA